VVDHADPHLGLNLVFRALTSAVTSRLCVYAGITLLILDAAGRGLAAIPFGPLIFRQSCEEVRFHFDLFSELRA